MSKQWIILVVLPLTLALGTLSCASSNRQPDSASASDRTHWDRLRAGMSYAQVSQVLQPVDPGIVETLDETLEQEREAKKERLKVLAELRTAGMEVNPELRSHITVNRGDYILVFRDGKLFTWELK
jgi:hypothetical protein